MGPNGGIGILVSIIDRDLLYKLDSIICSIFDANFRLRDTPD
jgi:hypothetical protein